ncbi:TetR/AcrR family transcriptional regulator [Nocardia sp. NPDC058176]|uniref:TetR/AcrR family transcriptional regulator n=1 Tax=Nocardia sp. NPDC058176 TaxID=3346368 RepID=UPI0036DCCCB5
MARGDTKARMVRSAIELLCAHGATAVTLDAVLSASNAPRGSIYHHFPGGRDELLLTAGRTAADYLTTVVTDACRDGDPLRALDGLGEFWRATLESGDYERGCPMVALVVDSRADLPGAGELVERTFTNWQTLMTAVLESAGAPTTQAVSVANLVIASLEGATILCRAHRSTTPLDRTLDALRPIVAAIGSTPANAT